MDLQFVWRSIYFISLFSSKNVNILHFHEIGEFCVFGWVETELWEIKCHYFKMSENTSFTKQLVGKALFKHCGNQHNGYLPYPNMNKPLGYLDHKGIWKLKFLRLPNIQNRNQSRTWFLGKHQILGLNVFWSLSVITNHHGLFKLDKLCFRGKAEIINDILGNTFSLITVTLTIIWRQRLRLWNIMCCSLTIFRQD